MYGVGIIQVDDESETKALAENDPAILSGVHSFEIYFMPGAVVCNNLIGFKAGY